MFVTNIITALLIIADEHDTRKKYKQNQDDAQKRVQTWSENMKQLKELQNKKHY